MIGKNYEALFSPSAIYPQKRIKSNKPTFQGRDDLLEGLLLLLASFELSVAFGLRSQGIGLSAVGVFAGYMDDSTFVWVHV